jgi:hypothetical protein
MVRSIALAGLAALTLVSLPAHAQLTGGTINTALVFPNVTSVFEDYGNRTVGAGVEYTNLASSGLQTDIGASTITVTNTSPGSVTFASVNAFFGFRFADVGSTLPTFTGLSIGAGTTIIGFTTDRLSFDANNLYVNLQGISFSGAANGANSLVLNVATSTVPEPGTWALLGTGLLAVGGIAARRKRTTV